MSLSEGGALNGFSKEFSFFARRTASRGQDNEIENFGFLTDEAVDRARS
jgi:hypothetical protein